MVSWGPGPWACAAGGALAAALAVVAALLVVVAVVDGEPFTLERIVLVVQPGAGSWPWGVGRHHGSFRARQPPTGSGTHGRLRPASAGLWGSIASSPNTTVAGGRPCRDDRVDAR